MKNTFKYSTLAFFILLVFNCREEFEIETQGFESVLVVEATLTDELKHQEIKLSRTYLLEQNSQQLENNAVVVISDDQNNSFSFSQNNEGVYVSDIEFKAEESNNYKLQITTADNKIYSSTEASLAPTSTISNLYAELNSNGEEIDVLIDTESTNGAKYFRYEFEETYKIIAPNHYGFDIEISNLVNNGALFEYDIAVEAREQEERICFTTRDSNTILVSTTSNLDEDLVTRFTVNSININDPVIITRYSILVKQYSQSLESYTFYKTLRDLGNSSGVLSESQPGFVSGNISNVTNENEKVIGFFDVAPVSTERIYFNFTDFNLPAPDYFIECNTRLLDYLDNTNMDDDPNERRLLYQLITINNYKLVSFGGTEYTIVNPECGDCTSFSSNVEPDFWED